MNIKKEKVVANVFNYSESESKRIQNVFFNAKSIEEERKLNQEKMRIVLKVGKANEVRPNSKMIEELFKDITVTKDIKAICELLHAFIVPSTKSNDAMKTEKDTIDGRVSIINEM